MESSTETSGTQPSSPEASCTDESHDQLAPAWYADPRFSRYWRHCRQVWEWYQRHLEAKHDAFAQYCRAYSQWSKAYSRCMGRGSQHSQQSWWSPDPQSPSNQQPSWLSGEQYTCDESSPDRGRHRTGRGKGCKHSAPSSPYMDFMTQYQQWLAYCNTTTPDGADSSQNGVFKRPLTPPSARKAKRRKKKKSKSSGHRRGSIKVSSRSASEEFEMEITDEMLHFFAQSARHRKERDTEKQETGENGEDESFINLADASAGRFRAVTSAPTSRPGAQRTAEMRALYGAGAPRVHGMETALQMTFDRSRDTHQPLLWPHLPLNIKFE